MIDEEDYELKVGTVSSPEYGFKLTWDEVLGLEVNGSRHKKFVTAVRDLLKIAAESAGGGSYAVTPEGPFILADEHDAASISWAVDFLYGPKLDITGDLPTMEDLGLDYGSNFDEDGNEIVR